MFQALRKAHENSFAAEEATTVTLAHEVTKEQRARREEAMFEQFRGLIKEKQIGQGSYGR